MRDTSAVGQGILLGSDDALISIKVCALPLSIPHELDALKDPARVEPPTPRGLTGVVPGYLFLRCEELVSMRPRLARDEKTTLRTQVPRPACRQALFVVCYSAIGAWGLATERVQSIGSGRKQCGRMRWLTKGRYAA